MATKTCITLAQETSLKEAIAKGDFSLAKLQKTNSSAERLELIQKHIPDVDVSKKIVRDIETRLGSKKETIVEDYIKRTLTSVPDETQKGVLKKFKQMSSLLGAKEEKDFMEELVAHKFGAYISKEEANKLQKLTMEAMELREKISVDATEITPESKTYAEKLVELENAESGIVIERVNFNKSDFKKFKGQQGGELVASWSKYLAQGALEVSGATRSFKATADVSATFRQLWKILSSGVFESVTSFGKKNDKLKIWTNSLKTTLDAVKQTSKYGDERVYDAIRAEIHAHPNSYNGVYDTASNKYGLRVGSEEQFPSSVPTDNYDKFVSRKGNLFKISEVAYNSTVLKARSDLANLTISTLKKADANVMNKEVADAAGDFVGAFTGRASLGRFESIATELNKVFFAPRFAVSQFSPYIEIIRGATTRADNKAARLAAKNNWEFLAGSAMLIVGAESVRSLVTGEDADYTAVIDPRSNQFGKVKFPGSDTTLDITGGNRSVMGLFGKISSKKYYDARLGTWREKGFFQLVEGKSFYDFVTGKYAPVPSILRDLKKGEHFGGAEITAGSIVKNLFMPITIDNVLTEAGAKEDMSSAMIVLGAELFGIGASDFRFKPQGDEWSSLLNSDSKAYWKAVDELWESVYSKSKALRTDAEFQARPRSEQAKKLEKMYKRELDKVIRQDKYEEVYAAKLEILEAEKEISVLDK
jgi:hypothetical protein